MSASRWVDLRPDVPNRRSRMRCPRLERPQGARYASPQQARGKRMKQLAIGDITIDAVIEREGPWRRPQDFFPAYDDAIFKHHLPAMEPEVFDAALGMIVITYQTFVVRTPGDTI